MKTYKINKISESAIYPLINEIKEVNNSDNLFMYEILKIILPILISSIFTLIINNIMNLLKLKSTIIILVTIITTILSLLGCFFLVKYLYSKFKSKVYTKGNDDAIKYLSEYFYRTILTNIIVAASFIKKTKEMDTVDLEELEIKNLYYYQALYHCKAALNDIREKRYIEVGARENYNAFAKYINLPAVLIALKLCLKQLDEICLKLYLNDDIEDLRTNCQGYINNVENYIKLKNN